MSTRAALTASDSPLLSSRFGSKAAVRSLYVPRCLGNPVWWNFAFASEVEAASGFGRKTIDLELPAAPIRGFSCGSSVTLL
mgnify:CR=1 FL=1